MHAIPMSVRIVPRAPASSFENAPYAQPRIPSVRKLQYISDVSRMFSIELVFRVTVIAWRACLGAEKAYSLREAVLHCAGAVDPC